MNTEQFTQALLREGYDVSTRTVEAHRENKLHAHPFEVRAMMLSGEMALVHDGHTQVCRAGDIFTMAAGCEHEERFGPEGASYVVGRRLAVG
jgi:quercetin dioxygenase-like cupin family protein